MPASQPANFNLQEFTDVGQLLVGGRLYTYGYGTTAQKTAFTDPDGTVPHTYTADGAGGQYIALNARGELPAPLYLSAGSYDIALKRADGSTVWTRKADGVDDIASQAISALQLEDYMAVRTYRGNQKHVYVTGYLVASAPSGISGSFIRDDDDKVSVDDGGAVLVDALGRRWKRRVDGVVNVMWFGARGNGSYNDTAGVFAAYNYLKDIGGGTLLFPNFGSIYRIDGLDVSGVNPPMVFDFGGSQVRPFSAAAAHSAIIHADNQGLGFWGTNIKLMRPVFDCRIDGATGAGDINYAIYLNWACIEGYEGVINCGKVANVYGNYAQYTKLVDWIFTSATATPDTWGAYFTGPDGAHRSNEVHLVRPKFFSNKNALFLGGCEKVRITSPTVQGNEKLGIKLSVDASGNGCRSIAILDPWFEINGDYSIDIHVAEDTAVMIPSFLTDGALGIRTQTCYGLSVTDAFGINTVTNITHPAGNNDTAAISWKGGNIVPTISLEHDGPSIVDVDIPRRQFSRKDNLLLSAVQADQGLNTVCVSDWFGAKPGVPKGAATNLFRLTQAAATVPPYRIAVLTVELFTWDDKGITSQFGYSGHTQRFAVMITNNSDGAPDVSVIPESVGTDLGFSTAYQAPGPVTLAASIAGDAITFSAQWDGAGAGIGGMEQQCIAYMLRGAGTNSFYMSRL